MAAAWRESVARKRKSHATNTATFGTRRSLSEPILATPDEDQTYRKLAWRLAPALFACYVVAYIDRINVGFAKLQMLGDLHHAAGVVAMVIVS